MPNNILGSVLPKIGIEIRTIIFQIYSNAIQIPNDNRNSPITA